MLIQGHSFAGFIQQAQDGAIHLARDIKIPVCIGVQVDQGAQFIVWPILDQDGLPLTGARDFLGAGAFIVEKIGPLAPRLQITRPVDQISLAQAALDGLLALGQDRAELVIRQKEGRLLGHVQIGGKAVGILGQILAMLSVIGLCCGQ